MNDADLVRAARDGSQEAYALLVHRYRDAVYGVAYHYLRNADAAQDAAQEALVRAYLCISQLQTPERFGLWVKRIAANVCRMRLRARRESTGFDDLPEPAASTGDKASAIGRPRSDSTTCSRGRKRARWLSRSRR